MGGIFTEIEREIIKMSEEVRREALVSAAPEIRNDIMTHICYKVTKDYYSEFKPKLYRNRMESLYNAWDMDIMMVGNGLEFDPFLKDDDIPQHTSKSWYHQYNNGDDEWTPFPDSHKDGTQNNGMPQSSWIVENFAEGIHPRYYWDREADEVIDFSKQGKGTDASMEKHVNKYNTTGRMERILIKHLQQACRTYSW